MATYTIDQAAVVTSDPASAGVRQLIQEENPIMDMLEWVGTPEGNGAHSWFEETSQGTAAFRAVNGTYTPDFAKLRPYNEPVAILGGELSIDMAVPHLYGNNLPGGIWNYQLNAKARAAYRKFEETWFEGDTGVDPNAFDGLRVRAVERGMEFDATGAGTDRVELTLAMLDEVLDAVIGGTRVIHLNQWLRRKVNALMRAAGQAREPVSGEFGRQYDSYAGYPMVIQERRNDMTTILGFDEDPGDDGDDAASIYVVHYGGADEDQAVIALAGAGGAWDAYRTTGPGGAEASPTDKARLEVYVDQAAHGNRPLARLKGIGQI